jgi:hypothetical protein
LLLLLLLLLLRCRGRSWLAKERGAVLAHVDDVLLQVVVDRGAAGNGLQAKLQWKKNKSEK